MRVSWDMNIGRVHAIKSDDEVMTFCESLIALGFTPEVTVE